jgi:KUP system potassium uptake protein
VATPALTQYVVPMTVVILIRRPLYDSMMTSFYLGRELLVAPARGNVVLRMLLGLFILLHTNELDATSHFGIPPNRVVELGTRLDLVAG